MILDTEVKLLLTNKTMTKLKCLHDRIYTERRILHKNDRCEIWWIAECNQCNESSMFCQSEQQARTTLKEDIF